ncbi:hypothetical protein WR25_13974 [Diploscapter pachys]|uniref:Uncharacterized protein n=1 Tax=Diploscapter pachys TaxID=2018661 RepID=A0A2A2M0A2_9BILA|nr:hypothetical protein WR25_13974 [Diploscapter pachys]
MPFPANIFCFNECFNAVNGCAICSRLSNKTRTRESGVIFEGTGANFEGKMRVRCGYQILIKLQVRPVEMRQVRACLASCEALASSDSRYLICLLMSTVFADLWLFIVTNLNQKFTKSNNSEQK